MEKEEKKRFLAVIFHMLAFVLAFIGFLFWKDGHKSEQIIAEYQKQYNAQHGGGHSASSSSREESRRNNLESFQQNAERSPDGSFSTTESRTVESHSMSVVTKEIKGREAPEPLRYPDEAAKRLIVCQSHEHYAYLGSSVVELFAVGIYPKFLTHLLNLPQMLINGLLWLWRRLTSAAPASRQPDW